MLANATTTKTPSKRAAARAEAAAKKAKENSTPVEDTSSEIEDDELEEEELEEIEEEEEEDDEPVAVLKAVKKPGGNKVVFQQVHDRAADLKIPHNGTVKEDGTVAYDEIGVGGTGKRGGVLGSIQTDLRTGKKVLAHFSAKGDQIDPSTGNSRIRPTVVKRNVQPNSPFENNDETT